MGHNYVNGTCSVCGDTDSSGAGNFYFSLIRVHAQRESFDGRL